MLTDKNFPNFLYLYLMLSVLSITRRAWSSMACSASDSYQGVFSVSYVTAPSDDVAKKLAEGLVKGKLAGCVNIVPGIQSIYEWEGEVQKDSEVLMVIKTRTSRLDEMTKYIRENHPYQVCEVISTPIQHGNPQYLKWLGDIVPEKK
ncbi:protein CutA homolog isoform X1 [Stegodyphus dumicola]|uniref:protein CutA homolog isoform X1 n=1 Tax=Stegodyphus dumicola TaxID=202533 RepID=UPI0015AC7058|nr:protein CutA homolog isoform X1 [Stegodyphus dumicola]